LSSVIDEFGSAEREETDIIPRRKPVLLGGNIDDDLLQEGEVFCATG